MATSSPAKTLSSSDSTTQEASNSSHTTGNRFHDSQEDILGTLSKSENFVGKLSLGKCQHNSLFDFR